MHTVTTSRRPSQQLTLWDWVGDRPLTTDASLRAHIGDFYEEAAASLLGADRCDTQTNRVCPDLQHRTNRNSYCEVKSIGQSRQGLLYDHRIEKYEQWAKDSGAKLHYLFWFHHGSGKAAVSPTLHTLHTHLAQSTDYALLVPMETVHDAALTQPRRKMNYQGYIGDPRRKIMWGRRLPHSWFKGVAAAAETRMAFSVEAYNAVIEGAGVIHAMGADWP